MVIISRIKMTPIEKYGEMSLDKFALYWYNVYPRPDRISVARWAAMTSHYVRNYEC
jgi:hypothetical protein